SDGNGAFRRAHSAADRSLRLRYSRSCGRTGLAHSICAARPKLRAGLQSNQTTEEGTMTIGTQRSWGLSRAALLSATSLASGVALAQSAPADVASGETVEEVVVTGTSIRGVAPVGSSLVS